MVGGRGRGTFIQDEYNEGKELCKEIKKEREREVLKAHVSVCTVAVTAAMKVGEEKKGISLY